MAVLSGGQRPGDPLCSLLPGVTVIRSVKAEKESKRKGAEGEEEEEGKRGLL